MAQEFLDVQHKLSCNITRKRIFEDKLEVKQTVEVRIERKKNE